MAKTSGNRQTVEWLQTLNLVSAAMGKSCLSPSLRGSHKHACTMQPQAQPQELGVRIPRGWAQLFPGTAYTPGNTPSTFIADALSWLEDTHGACLWKTVAWNPAQTALVATMSFDHMYQASMQAPRSDEIAIHFTEVNKCLRIAATEYLLERHVQLTMSKFGQSLVEKLLHSGHVVTVRLVNAGVPGKTLKAVPIRALRSTTIGKWVPLRGTVTRMSPVRPLVERMPFVCGKCGTRQEVAFPDGKYTPPTKCEERSCKAKVFQPVRSEAVCVDWQRIRIQEILGSDKQQEGQVPKTVDIELVDDLVGSVVIGDVADVFGEVKVLATQDTVGQYSSAGGVPMPSGPGGKPGKGPKQQSLFVIYIKAHSVHNVNQAKRAAQPGPADREGCVGPYPAPQEQAVHNQAGPTGTGHPTVPSFSPRDLAFIHDLVLGVHGYPFQVLVSFLAPGIYGHELVKAGLLLSLLGGVRKNDGVPGRVPIRGDVHVLVVGDPGLGKSQLLQACAAVAPRGLYVCGNTSSNAGLTVTVAKDAVTGDFVFEAGAVVLGDRGVCCVDEFDKMTAEHQALLEAMEQQEVSVAKAGMVATLPARTTILAAANPAEGHYNKAKSISENLKMSPAMLSRFDLIFILLDRPDQAMDQRLSEHVLALHSGDDARARHTLALPYKDEPLLLEGPQGTTSGQARRPLKERLKQHRQNEGDPPTQLLKKYIAYARQYATPRLTDEAKATLQEFYLTLRQQVAPGQSSPVTARQLESMVRLTEARARVDLREEATKDDALDVIEIMKEALYDKFGALDDTMLGTTDYRAQGGTKGRGKAAEAQRFLQRARTIGQRQGRDTFQFGELLALANEMALKVPDVPVFLRELNEAGELLKAGSDQYRVTGVKLGGSATQATSSQATGSQQAGPSQHAGARRMTQTQPMRPSQIQSGAGGAGWNAGRKRRAGSPPGRGAGEEGDRQQGSQREIFLGDPFF